MISKERMQTMMLFYRSRYKFMIESTHLEDIANAEACRLATQAWQTIMVGIGNPEAPEFRIESIIDEVESEWAEYLKTGISKAENGSRFAPVTVESIKADFPFYFPKQAMPPPIEPVQDTAALVAQTVQDKDFDPMTGQLIRKKKPKQPDNRSVVPDLSTAEEVTPTIIIQASTDESKLEPPLIKINQAILDHVSPRAIEEVVNTIKYEFGLEKQEAEIATSVSYV